MIPTIPPRTQAELENPAPPGSRHEQAIGVALSMLGNGLSPEAVGAQLRSIYDDDFTDGEIGDIVKWAEGRNPTPSGRRPFRPIPRSASRPAKVTPEMACAAVTRLLGAYRCGEADLEHKSPVLLPEAPEGSAVQLLSDLFYHSDFVNISTEYGPGVTMPRNEWISCIRETGVPSGSIGCLFRINPVSPEPTGDKGGYTDNDVTDWRFALVESDMLPLHLQLPVLARLPLPIAAIIFSGGKSYHALIRVDADDVVKYRKQVDRMLALLRPLGFDQATGNPSRMSRLPDAIREGIRQRLIYLNPLAKSVAIFPKEVE